MQCRPAKTYQTVEACMVAAETAWVAYREIFGLEAQMEMQRAIAAGKPDSAEHWRFVAEVIETDPRDWEPYGFLDREQPHDMFGPDCSCDCAFYLPLSGDLAADWGVCSNPPSHRVGKMTFEHQGCLHFTFKPE